MSDPVESAIAAYHGQQEAAEDAAILCFEDCRTGRHLDPENGGIPKCANWHECQGWRAYLRYLK